ncbi:MAG: hypothetical protein WBE26_03335 [Phycisphaerae bacterium]
MRRFFVQPLDDLASCLNRLVDGGRPGRSMCLALVAMVITWFLYVPVHELLHVAGCVVTGGTVSELEVSPQYGGALLARWFPFVVSGGEYAGRLSGFDTKGSDLIYLATDFGPFVLTVLFGVPLLRACARRRRPILFGIGVVVGLAPFYNLIGDYYEMGSVVTTRTVTLLRGGVTPIAFEGIRSDDIFKLVGNICTQPGELALNSPSAIAAGAGLICISFIVAVVLALATYALGDCFARILFRPGAKAKCSEAVR